MNKILMMLLLAAAVSGCAHTPRQMRSRPLDFERFTTLLDFEKPSDAIFVSSGGGIVSSSQGGVLKTDGGGARFDLQKLGVTPADPWTLLGACVYSERAITVEAALSDDSGTLTKRSIPLPARQWTFVAVDLTAMPHRPTGAICFSLFSEETPFICDDLLLVNNDTPLDVGENAPWTLRRRGYQLVLERPNHFKLTLPGHEGWRVEEAGALRCRFAASGKTRSLTVYPDGRAYWDGAFKPVAALNESRNACATQHQNPAEVAINPDAGRLNRSSDGDGDNDSYNESRGAYMLVARRAPFAFTLRPHTAELICPVIEITGIPAGKLTVSVEGNLIDRWTRLADGDVLLELPLRLTRPTLVSVHVRE